MLTYADLKKAEALALDTSARTGGRPMAIVLKTGPRPWWDFSGQSWAVVAHTPDVPDEAVIVGFISSNMKMPGL